MSQEINRPGSTITVTGARTVPTRPYGNSKWEFTITRVLGEHEYIGETLFELAEMITARLDDQERIELSNVNLG